VLNWMSSATIPKDWQPLFSICCKIILSF